MDGEDVVQEALIEAYRKLDQLTKPAFEAVVVSDRSQPLDRLSAAKGSTRRAEELPPCRKRCRRGACSPWPGMQLNVGDNPASEGACQRSS